MRAAYLCVWLWALGVCVGFVAYSEPTALSLLPLETSRHEASAVNGFFQLQNQSYTSAGTAYYRPGAKAENVNLKLALANDLNFGPGSARLALSDQYSISERWNYLNVNEAFVAYHQGTSRLSLGRKLDTWAEWEKTWNQGVFEPRYVQDGLNPEFAGLTGLFFNAQNEHWGVTVGALPINIPEFGPHFSTQDDKFVSANPWFRPPASQFRYRGVDSELHYSVDQSNISQIVLKPGAIAKTEYRGDSFFGRATYAYKPIAKVALGFPSDGLYRLPDYPQIIIHPRVVYDRIANLDFGYSKNAWRVSGSVTYDNPEQDLGPSAWTSQVFAPAWIFTVLWTLRLEEAGPKAANLEAGVLKVAGGDARDNGSLGDDQTKFERRFQYYEAYLVGVQREFRVGLRAPLQTRLRVIYDRMQNGGVLSFKLGYEFEKNWHADLGIDLIGLLGTSRAEVADGFLSSFRANDRASIGVNYVF